MKSVKGTLNLVAGSFAAGAIIVVVVLTAIDLGEPESPDLADGAALTATVFGVIGLLLALQWWSQAGETERTPAAVQIGFIVRVAIAELGVLLGILALVMTGSMTPAYIGLGLFLLSLLVMRTGLGRISE
ncbi:MAG: hypothetical protein GY788_03975 [bacterium]|nr:hypothetical protein [bacterium]